MRPSANESRLKFNFHHQLKSTQNEYDQKIDKILRIPPLPEEKLFYYTIFMVRLFN